MWQTVTSKSHETLEYFETIGICNKTKVSSEQRLKVVSVVGCRLEQQTGKLSKTLMECEVFFRLNMKKILKLFFILLFTSNREFNFLRLSMMPSLNSTHWTRTHTKIRRSSCSCWETTSRYGRPTHRVMVTNHQSATRINQTKLSRKEFEMKRKTNQQLSTKTKKQEEEKDEEI